MTVAARATAEQNTFGQRSYRVTTRRQSLSLPNMISIRLRRLYRHLLYFTVLLHCFPPGMHARIPLSFNATLNQPASYPRSPSGQSTSGRLLSNARAPMQSLTRPAVTNRSKGRLWLSQMARSFVFMPPLFRPIRRPRSPCGRPCRTSFKGL